MSQKRKIEELERFADADVETREILGKREMQGQGDKKHSIDSDEEDEVRESFNKFDKMDDNDIDGQEESKVMFDGDIAITPFNLKEEQQEGSFTKDGNFVWNKKEEITDSWLDNIDWVKIKEMTAEEKEKQEKEDEEEDEKEETYNEIETYRKMMQLMKEKESVAKCLRRLGGGKKAMSASQRWKKKKMGEEENPEEKENKEKMLRLTGLADQILSRSGNMEIYEETFESISFKIKQADEKRFGAKTSIPEDVDDDDALDMFADSLDDKTVGKGLPEASANGSKNGASTVIKNGNAEAKSEKKEIVLDEIMWEFKWENTEESEIHGPHASEKMHQWQESGFFDKGVFARKVGGGGEFNNSKRIDFELYT